MNVFSKLLISNTSSNFMFGKKVKECSAVFNQQMMGYNDIRRPNMEKVSVLPL